MKIFKVLMVLAATLSSAAFADCSYKIEDNSVWDYAPGTLTLDGQTYRCENDTTTYGLQRCRANSPDITDEYFAFVDADGGTVQVFRDADNPRGSHVCNGPAK